MDLSRLPVEYILKAAKLVTILAYLIAVIGASASYGTQVDLLRVWELGVFAFVIPATIDILAMCSAIALSIPALPEKDKKYVTRILAIAVLVSVTANVAGGHNWVARGAHAWPVVAYLFAEGIANRVKNFVATVKMAQAANLIPELPEPEATTPVHATATVQAPTTAAITAKPGSAKSQILELAAAVPPPSHDEIAAKVGVKPGWVKHVIKTAPTA